MSCVWGGRQDCGGKRECRYCRGIGGKDKSFALRRRRQRRRRWGRNFDWHRSGIAIVVVESKAVEEEEEAPVVAAVGNRFMAVPAVPVNETNRPPKVI